MLEQGTAESAWAPPFSLLLAHPVSFHVRFWANADFCFPLSGHLSRPEPDHRISLAHRHRPIPKPDAGGIDGARRMHVLELQNRVKVVIAK